MFDEKQPNEGHFALAALESMGILGVTIDDKIEYNEDTDTTQSELRYYSNSNRQQRTISLITQNVDSLHHRAGSQRLIQLHGRIDQVQCMNCGYIQQRDEYHTELESINHQWLQQALKITNENSARADGDAVVGNDDTYHDVIVPTCINCCTGFYKPRVVFFGDRVPSNRVEQCQQVMSSDLCNGVLVIGSSLAVHSAYRHVRSASQQGIPICIINVGETRAEVENLSGVTKIEAPAGPILSEVVKQLSQKQSLKTK
jgi:NAD-dependent SIR2 family protein deacetylase